MGENSKISWTTHTFNAWWGCTKIKQGCTYCYANRLANRWKYDVWGADKDRRFFTDKHYEEPLKWNRKAEKERERRRVFCGSMMDIFEEHGNEEIRYKQQGRREELTEAIIPETPWLDWLLLTKRPENVVKMVPKSWTEDEWPLNVWFGFSASTQQEFNDSCEMLWSEFNDYGSFPWVIFASLEPLLEPIDITGGDGEILLDWVIVGGETGKHIVTSHPRKLTHPMVEPVQAACDYWHIPFFFKQWGGTRPGGKALLNGVQHQQFPNKTQELLAQRGLYDYE